MISVAEALAHIREHQQDFGAEAVPLLLSGGRILAQDIFADRDFPPYDRVTMDGVAVSSKTFEQGRRDFKIEKLQPAGHPQMQLDDNAHCIEVMTGAVLPQGTDAVIPYEDCTLSNGIAIVSGEAIRVYQNVHLRGIDSRRGDLLILKGKRITAAMIGIMASVGMDKIVVQRLPKIAICATGDELVDITAAPEAHQVRRSNSYMLAAALGEEGILADTYHLPDDKEQMRGRLAGMLQAYDVLLFSGAVSKGKLDFLPEVLGELGMQTVFHRVAQKPGKPFLFGKFAGGAVIFGFPGNPVSTIVCYRIFFQNWLYHSLNYKPAPLTARLAARVNFKPALTWHLLVTLSMNAGVLEAIPCAGANSGDMISLEKADAIVTLPVDKMLFNPGEAYPATLLASIF